MLLRERGPEVLNRHKDVQYSSRIMSHIARQQHAHRLRHIINELARRLPESERNSPEVRLCRATIGRLA